MYKSQADAISDHVGCLNMGDRLENLARALNLQPQALMPVPCKSPHTVLLNERGMRITLTHPDAGMVEVGNPNRWVITDVLFGAAWHGPLPFGLDALKETPTTAVQKLGDDMTRLSQSAIDRGDLRQSFTLNDARVVELLWKPTLIGIDRVWVVRLGKPLSSPPT
jgi:hypothetical protein